jgi:hypothetical protein
MKLMRFKDNTFMWMSAKDNGFISEILPEKLAVAFGVWQLKIPRTEVSMGVNVLKLTASTTVDKKDNVAIFGDDKKIFLYTTKQGEA